ncbi:MAG: restriction endonuclease subunit S [Denitrovibrio sp.]|nr:MAG: restriction endonuclease subunit S [Denitrovibrio sp.]
MMDFLEKHFDTAFSAPNGIKKLRELILTLAMQGKLVPQDPSDQPASELLKDIKKEKDKLIAEGKIKKQKDLPPIKPEEIPYELPKDWKWVRLDTFTSIIMGQSPNSDSYNENQEGLPFFQGKSEYGSVYPTPRKWCSNPVKIAPVDSILISVRAPVGPTNICNIEACIGRGLSAIVPLANMPVFFLLYLFRSKENYISSLGAGSTFTAITLRILENLVMPLPPLAEQKRIVEKIDLLLARCDKLEKLKNEKEQQRLDVHKSAIHKLVNTEELNGSWSFIKDNFSELYSVKENIAELRKAIISLAMQGKLVPQDPNDQPASELLKDIQKEKEKLIKEGKIKNQKPLPPIKPEEIPYELPESWEWVRFGQISQHNSGKTLDKSRNKGELRNYITTSNLYWGHFLLDNLKQMPFKLEELDRCSAKNGDLLICEGGEAGRASVWNFDYEICFQNHIHRARFYYGIDSYYSFRFFEKLNATGEINSYRKGVAISNMSSKSLASIIFPLPPVEEQKRIVEKIDQLIDLCDELEAQIDSSEATQTSLLNSIIAQV